MLLGSELPGPHSAGHLRLVRVRNRLDYFFISRTQTAGISILEFWINLDGSAPPAVRASSIFRHSVLDPVSRDVVRHSGQRPGIQRTLNLESAFGPQKIRSKM
jgi:hypothetical protein